MIADCRVQAKWIYTVSHPRIENGIIEVRSGKVVAVEKLRTRSATSVDLGAVALIPGLVNAHTHLEFSDLTQPLGCRGIAFTEWIKLVVAQRAQSSGSAESKSHSIHAGIKESIDRGCVAIGEIASEPIRRADYGERISTVVFMEVLGRNPRAVSGAAESCLRWLQTGSNNENVVCAISPHAPYSVHHELLDTIIERSIQFRCPVAMHVAETREELQLLADQTGPFVELLDSLGAWFPETCPRGATALDILQLLSRAPRSLVIHGNYLDDAEIDFVARHSDTMSVVYCPRTHEFFEHETWPLEKFLGAGINVAIGTDSRASNPDLNLFEELKCLQRKFPDLEPEQILAMGTREGAVALGLPSAVASIAPGNRADFNIVEPIGGDSLLNENSVCIPLSLRMDGASGKGSSEPVAF